MNTLSSISEEAFAQALQAETTFQDICVRLGLKHSRYMTAAIRKRAAVLSLDFSSISAYRTPFSNKEQLSKALQGATSYSDILRNLGVGLSGNNRVTLKRYLAKFELDTSNVENGMRTGGLRSGALSKARCRPLSQLLIQNSPASRKEVKRRVIEEGLLRYECRKCSNTGSWNGEPLVLTLEHKNGVNDDHRLENLEFLCPNCHSQTSTFAGRNRKGKRIALSPPVEDKREAARAAKVQLQAERLAAINNAGLDFSKHGWATQAARVIGISPQKVVPWLRKAAPEFLNTCRVRGSSAGRDGYGAGRKLM